MYLSNNRLRQVQNKLATAKDNFVTVRANTPSNKASVYSSTKIEDKSGRLSALFTASETYNKGSDSKLRPEKPAMFSMERPSSSKQDIKKSFSKNHKQSSLKRLSDFTPGRSGRSQISWTPQYTHSGISLGSSQLTRSKSKSPPKPTGSLQDIVREEVFVNPKKYTFGSRQIKHSNNAKPDIPRHVDIKLPNYEPPKFSTKGNGLVKCYSACTNQGPIRQYNEDRVSIILNIAKPEHCLDWKKAAYFGVFDGHGGTDCADYLRDQLHRFLVKQKSFPQNIPQALSNSFFKCQTAFLEKSKNIRGIDKSGSCGLVVFIYGDTCYIANVGDSRAIMSSRGGDLISQLSLDHKASDEWEQKRIIDNGGRIYQTKLQNSNPAVKISYDGQQLPFILGPHRVLPGRLSVTRSFGDIQAKLPQFGGNPRAIICTPQIRSFKMTSENDFIILASDGIYDKLSNNEIIECVWQTKQDKHKYKSIHEFCGLAVENVINLSVYRKTLDNITVVMLGLEGLEKRLYPGRGLEVQEGAEKMDEPKIAKSTSHLQKSTMEFFKPSDSQIFAKTGLNRSSLLAEPKRNSLTGSSLFFEAASNNRMSQKLKHQRPLEK